MAPPCQVQALPKEDIQANLASRSLHDHQAWATLVKYSSRQASVPREERLEAMEVPMVLLAEATAAAQVCPNRWECLACFYSHWQAQQRMRQD